MLMQGQLEATYAAYVILSLPDEFGTNVKFGWLGILLRNTGVAKSPIASRTLLTSRQLPFRMKSWGRYQRSR
jgi:hypothetical protein